MEEGQIRQRKSKHLEPVVLWKVQKDKLKNETERDRELRLDTEFRQPLIEALKSETRKKPKQMASDSEASFHVMITRACRYTGPYFGYLDDDNLDDETEGL